MKIYDKGILYDSLQGLLGLFIGFIAIFMILDYYNFFLLFFLLLKCLYDLTAAFSKERSAQKRKEMDIAEKARQNVYGEKMKAINALLALLLFASIVVMTINIWFSVALAIAVVVLLLVVSAPINKEIKRLKEESQTAVEE